MPANTLMSRVELPHLLWNSVNVELSKHHLKYDIQIGQQVTEKSNTSLAIDSNHTRCQPYSGALGPLGVREGFDQLLYSSYIPLVLDRIHFVAVVIVIGFAIGFVAIFSTVFARIIPDTSWPSDAEARTSAWLPMSREASSTRSPQTKQK